MGQGWRLGSFCSLADGNDTKMTLVKGGLRMGDPGGAPWTDLRCRDMREWGWFESLGRLGWREQRSGRSFEGGLCTEGPGGALLTGLRRRDTSEWGGLGWLGLKEITD